MKVSTIVKQPEATWTTLTRNDLSWAKTKLTPLCTSVGLNSKFPHQQVKGALVYGRLRHYGVNNLPYITTAVLLFTMLQSMTFVSYWNIQGSLNIHECRSKWQSKSTVRLTPWGPLSVYYELYIQSTCYQVLYNIW